MNEDNAYHFLPTKVVLNLDIRRIQFQHRTEIYVLSALFPAFVEIRMHLVLL
jgi:hypothetical protein